MSLAVVTGAGGLIGSEAVERFCNEGFDVIGIDNDLRAYFFGDEASTKWRVSTLTKKYKNFKPLEMDIRNQEQIFSLFKQYGKSISVVIHTAAQPSHDWAAREPFTDFTVNANGTLVLLEAVRQFAPDAPFIFTSTNKVYGDKPNELPLIEKETRWEVDPKHPYAEHGIDESMSIDQSKHSLFGASKVAADILCQEYAKYFGLKTVTFRGGCLTGPAHSGAELHGFLAYLVKCALTGKSYSVFGYKAKQVRDNIHSNDLVSAFWEYYKKPTTGKVYNMGGSRFANCSMLEAIALIQKISGKKINYTVVDQARSGDHIWYVSDVRKFQNDYPTWKFKHGLEETLTEMIAHQRERL